MDILLALEIFRDSEWVDDLNSVLALFLLSYIFNDIGPLKGLGPELDMKLKHIEKNNEKGNFLCIPMHVFLETVKKHLKRFQNKYVNI